MSISIIKVQELTQTGTVQRVILFIDLIFMTLLNVEENSARDH